MTIIQKAFALVDPHWGEPQIMPQTVRDTKDEVIHAALRMTEVGLYSGYSDACVPPRIGDWDSLSSYGYYVTSILMTVPEQDDEG